jgi:hypothetical protein
VHLEGGTRRVYRTKHGEEGSRLETLESGIKPLQVGKWDADGVARLAPTESFEQPLRIVSGKFFGITNKFGVGLEFGVCSQEYSGYHFQSPYVSAYFRPS